MYTIIKDLPVTDMDRKELMITLQKHLETFGIEKTIENLSIPDFIKEDRWINEVIEMWNCPKITDITLKILGIGTRIQFMDENVFNRLLTKVKDAEFREIILGIRKTGDILELCNYAIGSIDYVLH